MPKRISFFLWKLRHGVITVDSFIQACDFPLASKCRCCAVSKVESLDHLFAEGDTSPTRLIYRYRRSFGIATQQPRKTESGQRSSSMSKLGPFPVPPALQLGCSPLV
uniref:Reverse transcriptase zinc-binding domain-containing protein n=1 Tax=Kalanchoe fedtschenkoi TaxID=63787 RepID=A0A7N0RD42_KALFE